MNKSTSNIDYRKSHTKEGKGENYDKSFDTSDYRQFVMRWEKSVLQKITSEIVERTENYLDFACGTGRITRLNEDNFTNSFGIDISGTMLQEAENKLKKTKLIHQDITKNNPFETNQMDYITSFRFFLNAEPRLRSDVLEQLFKILNPKGYFVFNIHNNKTIFSQTISILAILKKKLEGKYFIPQNSFSISDTRKLLKQHNFKIIKIYHNSVIPVKSENIKTSYSKYSKIERLFSNIELSKYFSKNVIYVCKKI